MIIKKCLLQTIKHQTLMNAPLPLANNVGYKMWASRVPGKQEWKIGMRMTNRKIPDTSYHVSIQGGFCSTILCCTLLLK